MATQTPTIITQGAMSQDSSGVNKYNPNTGNLLLPGQSVQVNPMSNQVSSVNPVIDANVATGTTSQLNLPNRPSPQAQSNLYSQAASIIANLPKTGVAGLDQTNQVLAQLPAYLYEQQGIGAKQTANSEAQTALKLFDEESRQRIERERTNPQLGLETLAARTYAIEKDRAFMAGTLAIKAAAASQDYETAMTVMKTMNEMIAEPLRQNAQFFKEMYMKTEDQKFQRAMKASDQSFQREMKGLDQLNDLKMQAFKDGKITAEQLATIRTIGDFSKITGTSASTIEKSFGITEKIKSIDGILSNNAGLRGSVGPTRLQRGGVLTVVPRGKLNADIQQLISQTTLDNLINAKTKGATFGALSEGELKLLSASGSRLATWAKTDKNGNITGFKASEQQVRDELAKIKSYAVRDYELTTGQTYKTQNDPAGLGIDIIQYDPAGLGI